MDYLQQEKTVDIPPASIVEGYVWPAMVLDSECRVLAANRAAQTAGRDALAGLGCASGTDGHAVDCLVVRAWRRDEGSGFCCEGSDWVFPLGGGRWLVLRRAPELALPPVAAAVEGGSEATARLRGLVGKVAEHDLNIILKGEAGSGRRRVARSIHDISPYRDGAFLVVNCPTLANPYSDQRETIQPPRNGTFFLNEVGLMPMPYQLLLLQVLEEEGGRVICSTRQDLRELVDEGEFLEELYYELAMLVIEVPPLRERREDIPCLARRLLLEKYGLERMPLLHPAVFGWLAAQELPGNLRELRNLLERAWLFRDARGFIGPDVCGAAPEGQAMQSMRGGEPPLPGENGIVPLKDVERIYLERITHQYQGSKHRLARQLGVSERTLYRKLRRLRTAESVS